MPKAVHGHVYLAPVHPHIATAHALAQALKARGLKVTRLARGVPAGMASLTAGPGAGFELRLAGKVDGQAPASTDVVLQQPGPLQLGCHLHGSMRGFVYVADTPWVVKTDAQGVATLPLALAGLILLLAWDGATGGLRFDWPLGPTPGEFVALMLAIGLLASWVGTLCWNEASQRLPTSLVGQLIVFETLAALAYAFMLRGQWPAPLTLAGIALLVAGTSYYQLRLGDERALRDNLDEIAQMHVPTQFGAAADAGERVFRHEALGEHDVIEQQVGIAGGVHRVLAGEFVAPAQALPAAGDGGAIIE